MIYLCYLGCLRLLGLDSLDLGVGDVEIRAVLLVPPGHLPQLLLPLFEQVLVEEGATEQSWSWTHWSTFAQRLSPVTEGWGTKTRSKVWHPSGMVEPFSSDFPFVLTMLIHGVSGYHYLRIRTSRQSCPAEQYTFSYLSWEIPKGGLAKH